MRWANDANDVTHKATYYPKVAKRDLIEEGYIASKSSHSRGSSIDLTLIDLSDPKHPELDMGSSFDLFDPQSHAENLEVTATQRANRLLLRSLMEQHGFRYYPEEWWHFFLVKEPYPKTYFDFAIR